MTRRLAAPVAAAALVAAVVLLVWAALAGPGPVLTGEGLDRVPLAEPTTSESTAAGESGEAGQERRTRPDEVSPLLRAIVQGLALLLELALAAAAAWLLWRGAGAAWQRWEARRRRDTHAEELTGAEELLDEEHLVEQVLRGAERRRHDLASGAPRNAVVACWVDLEGLAAAQGVERQPWETSTDLAARCLERTGADPDALAVLAAAYHRARYAAAPVTDADRSRALRALDRLHASLAEERRRRGVRA